MAQRAVVVRIEREIGEVLPKTTGETAKILKGSKRDLAKIIDESPEQPVLLSTEQQLKISEVVKRLLKVPESDAVKLTTTRWVTDLLRP